MLAIPFDGPAAQRLEQATHNFQQRICLICNYLDFNGLAKISILSGMSCLDRFGPIFKDAGYNAGYNAHAMDRPEIQLSKSTPPR